ncbi:MAG: type 1 glutamine amidotransferase [Syntrophorhabdaceae bacterium]|nr:type 1 glutamine amidotransferase [Syntrophorhabdaceae bacterium]
MKGKALFIKHVETEGPGYLEDFFRDNGFSTETIELSRGERIPNDLSEIDSVIILGGPMNVYEEDRYPFLVEEGDFIKKIIEEKIPLLGICLGAQLLAKACGAPVVRSPKKEIGWYRVNITDDGEKDPLFKGLERSFPVFQWHEDMFHIPTQGSLLARGRLCKNQAFKIGSSSYGLQFHIEVTEEMVESWLEEIDMPKRRKSRILGDTYKNIKLLRTQRERLFQNLAMILAQSSKKGDEKGGGKKWI